MIVYSKFCSKILRSLTNYLSAILRKWPSVRHSIWKNNKPFNFVFPGMGRVQSTVNFKSNILVTINYSSKSHVFLVGYCYLSHRYIHVHVCIIRVKCNASEQENYILFRLSKQRLQQLYRYLLTNIYKYYKGRKLDIYTPSLSLRPMLQAKPCTNIEEIISFKYIFLLVS